MDHRNKISCVPSLEDFLNNLRKHETEHILKYIQYQSTASFNSNDKFVPKAKSVIHWLGKRPYITVGTRTYICHKGKDRNLQLKKKNAESRNKQAAFDHVFVKRRKCVTKKLNCPASFHVKKVFMISNSQIPDITQNEKRKAASSIKNKISKGEEVPGQEMYLFFLPSTEDHKFHNVGGAAAALAEPLDSRVRQKIKELVRKGTRNVEAIRALTEEFVTSELHEFDKTRRRFYPTNLVIRNIIIHVNARMMSTDIVHVYPIGTDTCGIATSDSVIEVDAEHQDYSDSYDKLKPPRGSSSKKCLITEFKEQICILQQNYWELEEQELISVIARLKVLNEDVANAQPKVPDVGLPIVNLSVRKVNIVPANSDNVNGRFARPKFHPKENLKRVGLAADKQRENVNIGINMTEHSYSLVQQF